MLKAQAQHIYIDIPGIASMESRISAVRNATARRIHMDGDVTIHYKKRCSSVSVQVINVLQIMWTDWYFPGI